MTPSSAFYSKNLRMFVEADLKGEIAHGARMDRRLGRSA